MSPEPMSPFATERLQRYVEQALAEVPAGHGRATVRYMTDDGTVHFAVVARLNGAWAVGADLKWVIRQRKLVGTMEVVASW